MKAVFNNEIIAESNQTILLEGYHYFPPQSVKMEYFKEFDYESTCPRKGVASYYTISVKGKIRDYAAWCYKSPSNAAKDIKDHFAFWKGVRMVE